MLLSFRELCCHHEEKLSNACLTVDDLVAWVTQLLGQLSQLDLTDQDAVLPVPGLLAICQIFSSHASIICLYMLVNLIIVALSLYSMRWYSHPPTTDQEWLTFSHSEPGELVTGVLLCGIHRRRAVRIYMSTSPRWSMSLASQSSVRRLLDNWQRFIKAEGWGRIMPLVADDGWMESSGTGNLAHWGHRWDLCPQPPGHHRACYSHPSPVASQVPDPPDEPEPMQVGRMHFSAEENQRWVTNGLFLYSSSQGQIPSVCSVKVTAC